MKKTGILNSLISQHIASMGQGDYLIICDCGFPIPAGVPKVVLLLRLGSPGLLETVEVVSEELEVETIAYAIDTERHCLDLMEEVQRLFPQAGIKRLSHIELKEYAKQAKAVIRTGESTPYANSKNIL
ncbi:D-ribose pyranase [Risungbinella massiliensis]|uniref:D-ribose pyranase n=1 Tax=Risungbinella massiliensis TaxID=1329796 RepID=UPI0005CBCED0|nr:D-ribose pyranase [Risungbinella massiliensis]